MKSIKHLLKEAREAINCNNYEEAIQLSKSVLRQDEANYMAFIFLGLSYQETKQLDEALKAFRKAVNSKSDNALGWNGLINYYEKLNSKDAKKDLLQAYIAILKIERDPKKIIEYSEKAVAMVEHGDIKEIFDVVHSCKKKVGDNNLKINNFIVELCKRFKDMPENIVHLYEECLLELIEKNPKVEHFSSYLTLLISKKSYEELLYYAMKMHNTFPDDTISLTTICKTFNQLYVEEDKMAEHFARDAGRSGAKLLEIDAKNYIAMLTKSILFDKENKTLEAKDILIEVTSARPGFLHAWVFLTKVYTKLHLSYDAQQASIKAYKLNQSFASGKTTLKCILDRLSLQFLAESSNEEHWQAAVDLYKKVDNPDFKKDTVTSLIVAYINLRRFLDAQNLIHELEKENANGICKFLLAKCHAKEGSTNRALNMLMENCEENSQWWNEIGILYWDLGEYKKSYQYFLKSAKVDPNNYVCFMFLGKYYNKIGDTEKARRCYEKAFKIHSKSQEIAVELSKIYRKLKKYEASQNVLQNLTVHSNNKHNSTAWLQLGLSYLEQGDSSSAIDYLQSAVRIEKTNPVPCWEALADAYLAKESYTSALKCYMICLELSDQKMYPSLQIGNIKKILGEYTEAKTDFEQLLAEKKNYVPALVGLAETYMLQANDCYKEQRLGKAKEYAQKALDNLSIAVNQRKEFVCIWKLLGDVTCFLAKMPDKYCSAFIADPLIENEQSEVLVGKEKLFEVATRCYIEVTKLSKNNSLAWHDLSISYLNHALHINDIEKKKNLLAYAMIVIRYCVEANPNSCDHWNLMGVIAMIQNPPNYALAQHCFIKALFVNHDSAVAWSNLGVLYLLMNDVKLANKAFAQGQRSDPNHINSWLGQAMIAERIGHEEVLDLFRHTTQLGQHQQSGIGYGHWVCKTLLDSQSTAFSYVIQNMYAIPVACDALTWYIEKNSEDACAWNMLGILRERLGLKDSTLHAFANAYKKAPEKYRDLARVNYGRSLYKMGKYSEAIDIFQEVQEATFSSGSTLALTLFNDKQYEASHSAYEQALHWLTEEQSSQSDLLVALASMQYMFQGVDAAKTLLFQSIQLKPPSPWSLYSTLSLALLHQDWNLAQLVLDEMIILKDDQKNLPHYGTLVSCFYILQKQQRKAVIEISKLVHRHSANSAIWLNLSHLLLKVVRHKKPSLSAAKCAGAAMKLGQNIMDVKKVLSSASLAFLLVKETRSAIITAQKAIHTYPNVPDGWAVLSSALQKYDNSKWPNQLIFKLLKSVEKFDPSKFLLDWIHKQYAILN